MRRKSKGSKGIADEKVKGLLLLLLFFDSFLERRKEKEEDRYKNARTLSQKFPLLFPSFLPSS